jgi:hypothetical protein
MPLDDRQNEGKWRNQVIATSLRRGSIPEDEGLLTEGSMQL